MKELIAIAIAFGIGALCAKFQIPLPAPPQWIGVALIAAIWLGREAGWLSRTAVSDIRSGLALQRGSVRSENRRAGDPQPTCDSIIPVLDSPVNLAMFRL